MGGYRLGLGRWWEVIVILLREMKRVVVVRYRRNGYKSIWEVVCAGFGDGILVCFEGLFVGYGNNGCDVF